MKTYTDTHDWIERHDKIATIGIRQVAVQELGEIVYVELPKLDSFVEKGQEVAVLESTKAAIDLHSPLTGKVIALNTRLKDEVHLINTCAETDGWLYKLDLSHGG
jgi:glycine cleavage system H protein